MPEIMHFTLDNWLDQGWGLTQNPSIWLQYYTTVNVTFHQQPVFVHLSELLMPCNEAVFPPLVEQAVGIYTSGFLNPIQIRCHP